MAERNAAGCPGWRFRDLLDRQLALLVDVRYNHGLPSNLSGAPAYRAMINHGFKAVQIGTSA